MLFRNEASLVAFFAKTLAVWVRVSNRQMPLSTARVSRLNLRWFNYTLRRVQCVQHQIACESSFVGRSAIKISRANSNYAGRSPTTFRDFYFSQINQLRIQLRLGVSQLCVASSGKAVRSTWRRPVSCEKTTPRIFLCLLNASTGVLGMLSCKFHHLAIPVDLMFPRRQPRYLEITFEITATNFHWTALTNDVLLAKRNKIFAR